MPSAFWKIVAVSTEENPGSPKDLKVAAFIMDQGVERKYNPEKLKDGFNKMDDNEEIFYISNPAVGLWSSKERLI